MPTQPADLPRLWTQVLVGAAGFNEKYFSSNPDTLQGRRWGFYMARLLRYEVFWSLYEQNVYRKIHLWAEALKEDYDLYSAVRSVYSPAYRIGEFWAEHLFGGVLDPEAGDGTKRPSAIPIRTDNPDLRSVIARVWRWSNWQSQKDVFTRFGGVMGDVGLAVVDDPGRKQVYLKPIHPRIMRDVAKDPQGNVKGYTFEERRPDPRADRPLEWANEVTYNEVCTRAGRSVRFQTFLDEDPHDWRDYAYTDSPRVGDDWTEGYGFVPLVVVQHRDMGLEWGWSEYQPSLSKMMELDELVSKLHDQIRKLVECPFLFAGVGSAEDLAPYYPAPTEDDPAPERTRWPVFYAQDPKANATPLVAPLDIKAVADQALSVLRGLENDHPELRADGTDLGDASGRARRVAREQVEARVVSRRAGYDDALVRALKMAVSIGAMKGYPGFEAFDAGSYERGDLDFSVGDRPVFAVDALDHLEEGQARANLLKTLRSSDLPLPVAMCLAGYPHEEVVKAMAYQELDRQAAP